MMVVVMPITAIPARSFVVVVVVILIVIVVVVVVGVRELVGGGVVCVVTTMVIPTITMAISVGILTVRASFAVALFG